MKQIQHHFLFSAVLAAVLAGLVTALVLFCWHGHIFEYDELYTESHFCTLPYSEIFSDLATPNNHPLHTLAAKLSLAAGKGERLFLRIPAETFGFLLFFLAFFLLSERGPAVQITAAILLGMNPVIMHYSVIARGYSMQCFFVLGLAALLGNISGPKSGKKAFLAALCAAGACFSVSSGVIFVSAAALLFLLRKRAFCSPRHFIRKYPALLCFGGICAVVVFAWIFLHLEVLQKGQSFGTVIDSFSGFGRFLYRTAGGLSLLPGLCAAAVGAGWSSPKGRRECREALLFALLVFASAGLTTAGPPRVYSPLIAVLLCAGLRAIPDVFSRRKQYGKKIFALFCLALCLFQWYDFRKKSRNEFSPELHRLHPLLVQNLPPDILVAYRAGESYMLAGNIPEVRVDFLRRVTKDIKGVLFVGLPGKIEGLSSSGTTISFSHAGCPLPSAYEGSTAKTGKGEVLRNTGKQTADWNGIAGGGIPLELHPVTDRRHAAADSPVLMVLNGLPVEDALREPYHPLLMHPEGIILNMFFSIRTWSKEKKETLYRALVFPKAPMPPDILFQMERESRGKVRFFFL